MYKGKDILITCHCKTQREEFMHDPLYIMTMNSGQAIGAGASGTNVPVNQAGFKSVQYLDISPDCPPQEGQYHSWSCVPNESFDYIYAENCPIYMLLLVPKSKWLNGKGSDIQESKQIWKDILNEGYRILRQNGKLIIPFSEHPPTVKNILKKRFQVNEVDDAFQFQQYKNYIEQENTKWQIEMGNRNTIGFTIGMKTEFEHQKNYTTLLILTKTDSQQGGKRKYQTKKKKSKKRQTKKKN
jgi:hypothetical protein